KYRKLTNNERDSEGVTKGNIFGKPLQAAVHVANWHISDQFIAVKLDRIRVINSLLAHGADVNGRISMEEPRWSGARYRRHLAGATAFLLAAKAADVAVMRLLLAHGADPTINTEENITPLMAAAGIAWASNQDRASESQVLEAVRLMVDEVGADVNAVSDLGETAMHAAAYRGANSVVQYLFDKGASLDVVAVDGRTPLIVADGVGDGNSFAAQPQTAVLLRKLGAKERQCPPPCAAAGPGEDRRGGGSGRRRSEEARADRRGFVHRRAGRTERPGPGRAGPASHGRRPAAGCRDTRRRHRWTSRRARQVLRHLPQPAAEDCRTDARHVGSGADRRTGGGVGKSRAEDSNRGDAAGRTTAARQSAGR